MEVGEAGGGRSITDCTLAEGAAPPWRPVSTAPPQGDDDIAISIMQDVHLGAVVAIE